jgi:hypothetical protein
MLAAGYAGTTCGSDMLCLHRNISYPQAATQLYDYTPP